ncbi:MAG TPA: ABC transporter substrate-binding protein [Steroidobacteraceae bacterium]|nr:ABC transporter substrate-binding protein [Steroidobacteraceae bacterium]
MVRLRSLPPVAFCVALVGFATLAFAQDAVRIGVLSDMSGPYADIAGKGSLAAAELAIEEFGGKIGDRRIEIVSADHQNKPDVGSATARKWFDQDGVDVIVDVITSSVALAVQHIAREKEKIVIFSGAGASQLTGESCARNSFVWTWDTYALTNVASQAFGRENLRDWYLIEVDYALGRALDQGIRDALGRIGGKVVGVSRHPLGTADFSSFLLQAQSSGAPVIALLKGGADAVNALKQASEFQIGKDGKEAFASLAMLISDVKAIGLKEAQGLRITESFYWDLDDRSRAWSARYAAKMGGAMPSMIQAGTYSAVRHYLKAVETAGSKATDEVITAMYALPVEDATVSAGRLRADGRLMRDFYSFRVKSPAHSRGPWDLYERVATVPAEEAAVPATQSACPLLKGR